MSRYTNYVASVGLRSCRYPHNRYNCIVWNAIFHWRSEQNSSSMIGLSVNRAVSGTRFSSSRFCAFEKTHFDTYSYEYFYVICVVAQSEIIVPVVDFLFTRIAERIGRRSARKVFCVIHVLLTSTFGCQYSVNSCLLYQIYNNRILNELTSDHD